MRSRCPTGKVVASCGDPALVTYFRSSAKPIQALPVVRARPDLDDAEIAIACASHLHRPEQLEPVRAPPHEGRCDGGRPRVRPRAHAPRAQLLREARGDASPVSRQRAGRRRATDSPSHPCQEAMLAEIAAAAEIEPDVDADRRRRLWRRDLRAHARADGAFVLATRIARGRSPRSRGDARTPRR